MLISSSHQSLLIETIPLPFHRKQGLRLKYWSNERVHLTHVTTEPEQPTTGCCQHQDNLDDALVWAPRHHEGEDDAHHAPEGGEDDAGEE